MADKDVARLHSMCYLLAESAGDRASISFIAPCTSWSQSILTSQDTAEESLIRMRSLSWDACDP